MKNIKNIPIGIKIIKLGIIIQNKFFMNIWILREGSFWKSGSLMFEIMSPPLETLRMNIPSTPLTSIPYALIGKITKRNNPKTIIYLGITLKRSCLNLMKNIIDKTKNNVIKNTFKK